MNKRQSTSLSAPGSQAKGAVLQNVTSGTLAPIRGSTPRPSILITAAAKTWRRLKGENQLPEVVQGVTFTNGVEVINPLTKTAA